MPLPKVRAYNPDLPLDEPGNVRAWEGLRKEQEGQILEYERQEQQRRRLQGQPRSERSQGGLVNLPGYYQKGGLGISQMDTAAKQAHFGALNAQRAARLPGPRLTAVRQGRAPGVHLIHSPVPGRVDRIPISPWSSPRTCAADGAGSDISAWWGR
jgi:hypothetical protein